MAKKVNWRVELVDAQAKQPRRWVDIEAFNPQAAREIAQAQNKGWIGNTVREAVV